MEEAVMASAAGSVLALIVIISVVWLVATLVALARIASKSGYSMWWSLVYLIPVVNVVIFFIFAFSEWPIRRQLGLAGTGATASSTSATRGRPFGVQKSVASSQEPLARGSLRPLIPILAFLLFVDLFLNWNQQCAGFSGAQICVSSSGWDHGLGVMTGLLLVALLAWAGVQVARVEIRLSANQRLLLTVGLAGGSAAFALLLFVTNTSHVHIFGWSGFLLALALAYSTYREWASLRRRQEEPAAVTAPVSAASEPTLSRAEPKPAAVSESVTPAPAERTSSSTTVVCPQCGEESLADKRFCRHCGIALQSPSGMQPFES